MTAREGLRVVVWNIAQKPRALKALDESLSPDIALLNEATVPSERPGTWSREGTLGRDGKRRPWSAAVLTSHLHSEIRDACPRFRQNMRSVPFMCSRPGVWVAATVEPPGWPRITAVALYGLLDELSDASVHRSLSELSPLLDDPRYSEHVLIGGDLNTGTQWPRGDRWMERDRNLLERFRVLGLVDCLAAKRKPGRLDGCTCQFGDDCNHTRTRRDPRHLSIPYQTDYLFASKALADRLASCESLATDEWFALSDHAPIVANFSPR
jgi:endonuclease/exonuclease/phosphatase family metal-dependent hydrolase